jgi:AcrR family transcriptional regulator
MTSREEAKSKRKAAILASARDLLRQADGGSFSMRALAEAAGVSSATPYNLFGSKLAILAALLDADLDEFQTELRELKTDGIDLMFEAVALMQRFLAREPGFYHGVMSEMCQDGGTQLRQVVSGPRYALWKNMLAEATQAGLLIDDLDADAFALTLSQLMAGNLQEWAMGKLSLAEMDARIRYGLALLLSAIATDASRASLQQRWRDAERDLQVLWHDALQERLQHGSHDEASRQLLADQLKFLELQQVEKEVTV